MLTNLIKKVFTNREVKDQPFPEVAAHTHNGVDSLPLAPQSVGSQQMKSHAVGALFLKILSTAGLPNLFLAFLIVLVRRLLFLFLHKKGISPT